MTNRQRITSVITAAVLTVSAMPTFAQTTDADPPATTQPAGTAADLADLLGQMSDQELTNFIAKAAASRLAREREQVAVEINQGLLYEPRGIRAAREILTTDPKNTQQDNIERIFRAYAAVDIPFRRMWDLYQKKDYARAADAGEAILNANRTDYLSAASHYLCAQALYESGRFEEAVDVYRDILVNMPDRISFAAGASLEAARSYEAASRFRYAMEMYAYCLKNYSLTLSDEEVKSVSAKIDEYAAIYDDPLGTVVEKMDVVQRRLAAADSGPKTRENQQQIVAILDDLIKTAEEQSNQQQSGSSSQSKPGEKQSKELSRDGQQKPQGTAGQPTGQPDSPAQVSSLVPGAPERPAKTAVTRTTEESGDWAQLPPREREKRQAVMRKLISERRRRQIEDYHSALAEETP